MYIHNLEQLRSHGIRHREISKSLCMYKDTRGNIDGQVDAGKVPSNEKCPEDSYRKDGVFY